MVFLHPVLETLSMSQGKPGDPSKEQHWRQLLERWQDSGLSVRVFCRRHRLAEPTFYAWRRTLAQLPSLDAAEKPLTFVPIDIRQDTPPPPVPTLELVLGDGRLV